MRLSKDFFSDSAIELAPKLLGKLLCRKIRNEIIKIAITETEAYFGEEDTACMHIRERLKELNLCMRQEELRIFFYAMGFIIC